MPARVLYDYEVEDILLRHPEIDVTAIPSHGVRIVDKGKDILVGIVAATGKIRMVDITAYDDEGERIDPAIVEPQLVYIFPFGWVDISDQVEIAKAVFEGAGEAARLDILPLVKLGLVAVIGFFAWQMLKK